MKAKSAIQKGKDLENYVADQLREKGLHKHAQRSAGSGSGTREKADITAGLMILGRTAGIECKNYKNAHIQDWWRQTLKLQDLGREPILIYKLNGENYGETKAVIYLDTLLDLMKKAQEPRTIQRELNRQDKYTIEQLKNNCNKVLKLFK